jgi:hypothetical protein
VITVSQQHTIISESEKLIMQYLPVGNFDDEFMLIFARREVLVHDFFGLFYLFNLNIKI